MNDWKALRWVREAPTDAQNLAIELLDNQFGNLAYDPHRPVEKAMLFLWSCIPQLSATKYITVEAAKQSSFRHDLKPSLKEWLDIGKAPAVAQLDLELEVGGRFAESMREELDVLVLFHLIESVFQNKHGIQVIECPDPTAKKMDTIGSLIEDRTGLPAEWSHTNWLFKNTTLRQYPWEMQGCSVIGNRHAITLRLSPIRLQRETGKLSVGIEFKVNPKAMLIVKHQDKQEVHVNLNLNTMLQKHREIDFPMEYDFGNGTTQARGLATHSTTD